MAMESRDVGVATVLDANGNVRLESDKAWRSFSFPMSKIRTHRDSIIS